MNALQALTSGARRTAGNKRVVLLYWLLNLAAAVVVVAPIAAVLMTILGHRIESERLFHNLEGDWVAETLLQFSSAPFTALPGIAIVLGALYLVLSTFLAGGAIALLYRPRESYFAACARYFPRFFRILLISAVFYGIALALVRPLTSWHNRWAETSMSDAAVTSTLWVVQLIGFALLVWVNAIFDYAKIVCVVEDRKAIASTRRALAFMWRNFGSFAAIAAIVTVTAAALLLLYTAISELIGQASMAAVVVLFCVRQAYVLFRFWMRVWTWGSEMELYESRRAVLVAAPAAALEPEAAPLDRPEPQSVATP